MTYGQKRIARQQSEAIEIVALLEEYNDNYFDEKQLQCHKELLYLFAIRGSKIEVKVFESVNYDADLLYETKENVVAYFTSNLRQHSELHSFLVDLFKSKGKNK